MCRWTRPGHGGARRGWRCKTTLLYKLPFGRDTYNIGYGFSIQFFVDIVNDRVHAIDRTIEVFGNF